MSEYINTIKSKIEEAIDGKAAIYTAEEMLKLLLAFELGEITSDSVSFPIVILDFINTYRDDVKTYISLKDGEECVEIIDFSKSLPLEITTKAVIYSEDVQGIIGIEDKLKKAFEKTIYFYTDNSVEYRFELSDEEIIRDKCSKKTFDKDLIFSSLTFNCGGCLEEYKDYHPAEVAFDKEIQKDLLKQAITLTNISEKSKNKKPSETDKAVTERKNKILALLFNVQDYSAVYERFGKDKTDLYLAQFLKEMEEGRVDLNEAIKRFEKRRKTFDEKLDKKNREIREKEQKEEDEKNAKEKKEKLLTAKGDPVINRFTDTAVKCFKAHLSDKNIRIYGGSSFMEFFSDCNCGKEELPCIVLETIAAFSDEINAFSTCDINENIKTYSANSGCMPFKYCVFANIYAKSTEELDELEERINKEFANEIVLKVKDLYIRDEFDLLKMQVNASIKPDNSDFEFETENGSFECKRRRIHFVQHPNVYHYIKTSKDALEYDQQLQYRTMQQLQYAVLAATTLRNNDLPNEYDELFCLHTYKMHFRSSEYKLIANALINGGQINIEAFNKEFKPITMFYPQLYDRSVQHWNKEQIIQEKNEIAKAYEKRAEELYDLLDVPKTVESWRQKEYSGRDNKALNFYINDMLTDPFETAEMAYKKYLVKLYNDDLNKEFKERERAEAAQYESQYSGGDSDSGSGILESAIGSYLGTTRIRREEKKQTRLMEDQLKFEKQKYEEEKRRREERERWKRRY